ncbi:hypothetical protein NEOLEDRAFT_1149834 [Neolentinus lepideus HHB14362 ss-1]|uniref:F-box domain-containing protein n=1 Tax=Neolentinus lepideus HHB14362 ss-1 TaxID=1314782 RepID=A0A165QRD7_9AGAM|nr:hypothetical protein NEOLEDRAFT_1149834 [Neolentinus lepideus HHB14362 ss-1]
MTTRRSTRKRVKPTITDPELAGDEEDVSDHDTAQPDPKRRKQAVTMVGSRAREKKRRNSNTTGLKKRVPGESLGLSDMPLDVLIEIFSYSHPLDVLHLARCSKSWRAALMNRNSAFLWRAAIANLTVRQGLPSCPSDLHEPKYVNLLFEFHCTFCHGPTIDFPQWGLRVKCCRKCMKTQLLTESQAQELLPRSFRNLESGLSLSRITSSIPGHDFKGIYIASLAGQNLNLLLRSTTYYLKSDIIALSEELKKLTYVEEAPHEEDRDLREFADRWTSREMYRVERFKEQEFHAILPEKLTRVAICDMTLRLGSTVTAMNASPMPWMGNSDITCRILYKLRELGYDEVIEEMTYNEKKEFDQHPSIKEPKELTERVWSGVKWKTIEFMEALKAKHQAEKWTKFLPKRLIVLKKVLKDYYATRAETEMVPSPADILFMEDFLSIVYAPKDVQVTESSFIHAVARLPELSELWRASVCRKLSALLPESSNEQNHERVALATSQFLCPCRGTIPLTFEQMYVHSCMTDWNWLVKCEPPLPGAAPEVCCSFFRAIPWGSAHLDKLTFDVNASKHARHIVEICGKNPDITTAAEMDQLHVRFECFQCPFTSQGFKKRAGLTWRHAVSLTALLTSSRQQNLRPSAKR